MQGPHVLVVDDDPLVLRAIRRAARHTRPDWTLTIASTPPEALAIAADRRVDVVVTDVALATHDGGQLLAVLSHRHPEVLRVLFTASEDRAGVPHLTRVAHRILRKGPDPRGLLAGIDELLTSHAWLRSSELRRIVFGAWDLPGAPEITPRLEEVARNESAKVADLADVVARDPAVVARVLRIAGSVYFGGRRRLRTLEEAIARLGVRTLKALVLATEIVARFDVPRQSGVSADTLARHGFRVGRTALEIAQDVAPPLAEVAFLAGVVHDIGQLVLADRWPERTGEDRLLAHRTGQPLHVVEGERHGVTHAIVGAALLHLWGFDPQLVDGVLEHHRLPSERSGDVDVASIVWVAQAAVEVKIDESPPPQVVEEVHGLGWTARFASWAEIVAGIA